MQGQLSLAITLFVSNHTQCFQNCESNRKLLLDYQQIKSIILGFYLVHRILKQEAPLVYKNYQQENPGYFIYYFLLH